MNNAHDSHWTAYPHPDIPNVLPGWRQDGKPADYYLDLGEMLVRNATTDIRGQFDGTRIEDNNSIFIFEVAGLCIGHLGHLHHEPSDETYAAIGRLDVVMAAVDGGLTVDIPTMIRIVKRLRSSIVLPMHWFSGHSLDRFLTGVADSAGDRFTLDIAGLGRVDIPSEQAPGGRGEVVGVRPEMFTVLFSLARTVGWIAQWKEMIEDPKQKIGRPRQLYTGEGQRDYVNISDRK